MPTYDYECINCGYVFEHFQSMNDDTLTVCPECEGSLKRLIGGGSGIIFKGTGFYVNDAKKSTSPDKSKSDSTKSNSTKSAS